MTVTRLLPNDEVEALFALAMSEDAVMARIEDAVRDWHEVRAARLRLAALPAAQLRAAIEARHRRLGPR